MLDSEFSGELSNILLEGLPLSFLTTMWRGFSNTFAVFLSPLKVSVPDDRSILVVGLVTFGMVSKSINSTGFD